MGLEPVKVMRLRRQASSGGTSGSTTPTSGAPSVTGTNSAVTPTTSGSTNSEQAPLPTAASGVTTSTTADPPSTTPPASATGSSSSSQGPSNSQGDTVSSSSSSASSSSSSASDSSNSSASQSSSSSSISTSSSSIQSTTSVTSSSTSSTTERSSSTSTSASSTISTSTSDSSSSSESSLSTTSTPQTSSTDTSASLTTITSSIVTTINGQKTTIATTFPTSLNSAPSSSTTSGTRSGIIAGSAIGATLLVLLVLAGVFVFHRRRARRKIALAHRALPAPRSALLADEDAFDLAGGPSQPMGEGGLPPLLRPRGMETGSIFHEGVWPPPSASSRLEDPLLAGSSVDLTSIVDAVMGAGDGDQHGRSSSGDTTGSSSPLLANISPERRGDGYRPDAPPSAFKSKGRSRLAVVSDASETTPLNPSGHAHQLSLDNSPEYPSSENSGLPPGAADPVVRGKSGRSVVSVSTIGSPSEMPHLRSGQSGFGSLVVVNNTPDREQEYPLVDLTPGGEEPPKEIPPLYHMIRRDTEESQKSPLSTYSQPSNADAQAQLSPTYERNAPSSSGQLLSPTSPPSPSKLGHAL